MKSRRKPARARRLIAWAIRGGKCISAGRPVYLGLIGTVFPPRSGAETQALFKTRARARAALQELKGPLKFDGKTFRAAFCALPNARVERVEVIIRPVRRRR